MGYFVEPGPGAGWTPLFPLPELVHLPGSHLPLHIFEPRYRQMVKDALEGDRLIAMATILPAHVSEHLGAPPIDPWVGVGKIVGHQALPDGRSNILLEGVARARVLEEDRSRPYRLGRLEVQPDDATGLTDERKKTLRDQLVRVARAVPESFVRDRMKLEVALTLDPLELGRLVDIVADCMGLDADLRLAILREVRVVERTLAAIAMLGEVGSGPHGVKFSRN